MSSGFDEVIHPQHRLRICAMLTGADSWRFTTVRDALEVSDSVLSKQVKILQEAGYVTVTKARHGSYPTTWLAITQEGRKAFDGHLAALRQIAELSVDGGADRAERPG